TSSNSSTAATPTMMMYQQHGDFSSTSSSLLPASSSSSVSVTGTVVNPRHSRLTLVSDSLDTLILSHPPLRLPAKSDPPPLGDSGDMNVDDNTLSTNAKVKQDAEELEPSLSSSSSISTLQLEGSGDGGFPQSSLGVVSTEGLIRGAFCDNSDHNTPQQQQEGPNNIKTTSPQQPRLPQTCPSSSVSSTSPLPTKTELDPGLLPVQKTTTDMEGVTLSKVAANLVKSASSPPPLCIISKGPSSSSSRSRSLSPTKAFSASLLHNTVSPSTTNANSSNKDVRLSSYSPTTTTTNRLSPSRELPSAIVTGSVAAASGSGSRASAVVSPTYGSGSSSAAWMMAPGNDDNIKPMMTKQSPTSVKGTFSSSSKSVSTATIDTGKKEIPIPPHLPSPLPSFDSNVSSHHDDLAEREALVTLATLAAEVAAAQKPKMDMASEDTIGGARSRASMSRGGLSYPGSSGGVSRPRSDSDDGGKGGNVRGGKRLRASGGGKSAASYECRTCGKKFLGEAVGDEGSKALCNSCITANARYRARSHFQWLHPSEPKDSSSQHIQAGNTLHHPTLQPGLSSSSRGSCPSLVSRTSSMSTDHHHNLMTAPPQPESPDSGCSSMTDPAAAAPMAVDEIPPGRSASPERPLPRLEIPPRKYRLNPVEFPEPHPQPRVKRERDVSPALSTSSSTKTEVLPSVEEDAFGGDPSGNRHVAPLPSPHHPLQSPKQSYPNAMSYATAAASASSSQYPTPLLSDLPQHQLQQQQQQRQVPPKPPLQSYYKPIMPANFKSSTTTNTGIMLQRPPPGPPKLSRVVASDSEMDHDHGGGSQNGRASSTGVGGGGAGNASAGDTANAKNENNGNNGSFDADFDIEVLVAQIYRVQDPNTGQRVYACPVSGCSLRAARHYNVKTHLKTHIKKREKTHACGMCGRRYLRSYELVRHVQRKHGTGTPTGAGGVGGGLNRAGSASVDGGSVSGGGAGGESVGDRGESMSPVRMRESASPVRMDPNGGGGGGGGIRMEADGGNGGSVSGGSSSGRGNSNGSNGRGRRNSAVKRMGDLMSFVAGELDIDHRERVREREKERERERERERDGGRVEPSSNGLIRGGKWLV
ncbi:hypothetical protein HDU76_003484, partial [Blyttiomyces sp. JEL0837]